MSPPGSRRRAPSLCRRRPILARRRGERRGAQGCGAERRRCCRGSGDVSAGGREGAGTAPRPASRGRAGLAACGVGAGPGRAPAGRGEVGASGAAAVPRLWPATPAPLSEVFQILSSPSAPVRPAALFRLFVFAALLCSYRPSARRAASPPTGGALGVPQSGAGALGDGARAPRPAPPLCTLSLPVLLPCTPPHSLRPSLRPPGLPPSLS